MAIYYVSKGISREEFPMSADNINEVRRDMIRYGPEKNVTFHVSNANRYIGALVNRGEDGPKLPKYWWTNANSVKVYSVNPKTGTVTVYKPKKKKNARRK